MPLTELQCKNAKPKEKAYKLTDGGGLVLLIKPNGGKYWQLYYSFNTRRQTISFGTYPNVSLSEARSLRHEARKSLHKGENPSTQRKQVKLQAELNATNTFQAVAEDWMNQQKPRWDERHAAKINQRLTKHIFPVLGKEPISSITPLQILKYLRKIEETGKTEVSQRIHSYCQQVFDFGIMTQRCIHNPCRGLRKALKAHKAKHYPRIPVKELPEFFERLRNIETSEQNRLAMQFLMLTFVRQGEMRKARWDDIDWKNKEWRLPAPTTKMKFEHIVPLSDQALEVLNKLKAITLHNPTGLILPSQNRQKNPGMSENTLNVLLKNMGYKDRMVPHGCRGIASTHLNETGKFRYDVIERQLAHLPKDQVRSAYNFADYLPERVVMMDYWGEFIAQAMKPQVIYAKFGNAV